MAKRPLPAVAADFARAVDFLKSNNTIPSKPTADLLLAAKRIHAATYSLILWKFRLGALPEHGRVFIEELASDALQVLPQVMMGYNKTAKLLIRGVIENVLRHIYFADHPVEFLRMNRDAKWYLSMDELYAYAKAHPAIDTTEKTFDAVDRLSALYSDLSAGVHGRRVRDLEMRAALSKIVYDQAAADAAAHEVMRCAEAANFLLAMFHREKMRGFRAEDRRIFLRSMPERARQLWNEHDGP